MAPIVVIVGRPNVGKSTLFNRLSRSRDALVDDQPGITRDRLYAPVHLEGKRVILVDTGGFEDLGRDTLLEKVRDQVQRAIEESDKIIFMVDGRQGVMPGDEEIMHLLRRSQKKVILAVNKVDGPEHDSLLLDFHRFGLEAVYPVSAAHGYGLRPFVEDLVRDLPQGEGEEEAEDHIRVAVLGRPNVGKSSLINRILGQERLLVSEVPGTTRDAVDSLFQWRDRSYLLIDTAGIRKKARVKEKIEKFSVLKAIRGLERCHVAVILLDADRGVSDQDARICGYALERGRGIVLAVNKWDLVAKDPKKTVHLKSDMERRLKFVSFAPRVNVSALTGARVMKVFDNIDRVYNQFSRRVNTPEVNRVIQKVLERHPPPRIGRGRLKVFYATQIRNRPPTFALFLNRPDMLHFSYERFLINELRQHLELDATPIRLQLKKRR